MASFAPLYFSAQAGDLLVKPGASYAMQTTSCILVSETGWGGEHLPNILISAEEFAPGWEAKSHNWGFRWRTWEYSLIRSAGKSIQSGFDSIHPTTRGRIVYLSI
jgi:hypothetical protein